MRVGELWGAIPSQMEVKIVDTENRVVFVGKRDKSEILQLWNHSVKDFYELKEQQRTLMVKIDGVEK